MFIRLIRAAVATVGIICVSLTAIAQDTQSDMDRAMRQAEQEYKRQQADREREAMRDKSHDPPRGQVGPNTSVGVDPSKPEVNLRHTTP